VRKGHEKEERGERLQRMIHSGGGERRETDLRRKEGKTEPFQNRGRQARGGKRFGLKAPAFFLAFSDKRRLKKEGFYAVPEGEGGQCAFGIGGGRASEEGGGKSPKGKEKCQRGGPRWRKGLRSGPKTL